MGALGGLGALGGRGGLRLKVGLLFRRSLAVVARAAAAPWSSWHPAMWASARATSRPRARVERPQALLEPVQSSAAAMVVAAAAALCWDTRCAVLLLLCSYSSCSGGPWTAWRGRRDWNGQGEVRLGGVHGAWGRRCVWQGAPPYYTTV